MSKITIQNMPYITSEDAETLVGVHFSKFEFTQMAENGSFVRLDCSDAGLEELYEDQEWEAGKCGGRYERITNQIKLVEILRKQYGLMYEILVYVAW